MTVIDIIRARGPLTAALVPSPRFKELPTSRGEFM